MSASAGGPHTGASSPNKRDFQSERVEEGERQSAFDVPSRPSAGSARARFARACAHTCGEELKLWRAKVARRVCCEPSARPRSDATFPPEAASIDAVWSSPSSEDRAEPVGRDVPKIDVHVDAGRTTFTLQYSHPGVEGLRQVG